MPTPALPLICDGLAGFLLCLLALIPVRVTHHVGRPDACLVQLYAWRLARAYAAIGVVSRRTGEQGRGVRRADADVGDREGVGGFEEEEGAWGGREGGGGGGGG